MLAAIGKMQRVAQDGRARFDEDELVQVYLTHHLLVFGEAALRMSEDTRHRFPEIAWGKMIGMRNALVHGCFAIELDIVWDTVQRDIPGLAEEPVRLLDQLG